MQALAGAGRALKRRQRLSEPARVATANHHPISCLKEGLGHRVAQAARASRDHHAQAALPR